MVANIENIIFKRKSIEILIDFVLYIMGLFSTFMIMKVADRSFSWLLGIFFILLTLFFKLKNIISIYNVIFLLFLCSLSITEIFDLISIVPVIVIYLVSEFMTFYSIRDINYFIKGLKMSCCIQLIWCIIQYLCFQFNFDINNFVFNETLHLVENASFGTSITGLAWHPCNLIPTLLLSVLLFDKWYVWLVSFFIAVNAKSSTTIMALMLALFFMMPRYSGKFNKLIQNITIKRLIIFSVLMFVFIIVFIRMFPVIYDEVMRLLSRVGSADDVSTKMHKRYYTSLFFIWENSSLYQILFGRGYHNSGSAFAELFHQYLRLDSWSVESDPMDLMYGVGLIGFLFYYIWLFQQVWMGLKKDYKYFVFFITIILCGIAYNCQFEWVIQLELIFAVCIKRKINIFSSQTIALN